MLKKTKFLIKNLIKKVLLISGQRSFYRTGADKLFETKFAEKQKFLYLKKSYFPNFEELKEIIFLKEKNRP